MNRKKITCDITVLQYPRGIYTNMKSYLGTIFEKYIFCTVSLKLFRHFCTFIGSLLKLISKAPVYIQVLKNVVICNSIHLIFLKFLVEINIFCFNFYKFQL